MSKLQGLNVFLTERLTLAAQEILKAVEDIFRDYNDEMCRSRQEIQLLKRKLHDAGVQFHSETQPCSSEIQGKKYTQTFSEEQRRSDHYEKDTEMHMKLEVYTQQEENGEQMRVFNETTSLQSCMDDDHNQTVSKGVATQMMENCKNNFTFINHGAQIKNEPEPDPESETTCQAQRIIKYSSDDTEDSDSSSNDIKIKVNRAGSPAHNTQTYELPLRNQEIFAQHRMELAQISERWGEEERKKAAAKARSQKHKQKVYGNPELLEEYRKKERESKLQTQLERNGRNKWENEELHRGRNIRHTEEEALDKEQHQQTQPKTNLASICLEDIQHEKELPESYHAPHDIHGNTQGTGEYSCVICSKRFGSSGVLKIHLRVHSGEKPYHCSFCGKNFRQSTHLKTHVRIHTGERPHICKNCGKTFIDSSARNRHFKKCILIALKGQ